MNLVFFSPPRRVEEGQRKDGRAGADCARRSARICLCRLRTHYNLGKHIRSLSPYTKLSLIMDTALQLFCSLFPSPPALPPPSALLPLRPTLPFPPCFSPPLQPRELLARSHGRCAYIIMALATQPAEPKQSPARGTSACPRRSLLEESRCACFFCCCCGSLLLLFLSV